MQRVHLERVLGRTRLDRISACGVVQGREAYGSGVHIYVEEPQRVTCTACLLAMSEAERAARARIVAKRVLQVLERELRDLDASETVCVLREVKDDVEAHLAELSVGAA